MRLAVAGDLLKRTTSRCPLCHRAAPAEVLKRADASGKQSVWLVRRLARHCVGSVLPGRVFGFIITLAALTALFAGCTWITGSPNFR